MHQDIIPLYAADIQDQLKKQFAYLSGGRGGDGCPVITFPDYPAFSEIPEKEFQNVLTYLTSIPRRMSSSLRSRWLTKARTQCGVLRNAIVRGTAWCVKLGNEPGQVTKRNKITSQSVGVWEL
uniref:Guanine nucleotide exchange factor DBS n=1 Tax=Anas platyrhynchos TaxID=8839 RepID=R0JR46_ANAPL|nr:Guanine nucleotide exchange factor DBS [Anas platyrhynchos]